MFELIFGLFWTAFSCFFAFMFYGGTGGDISVNGQYVTQEAFNGMLGPKIFIGVFILIGVVMIVIGLKKILTNAATSMKGVESYGTIVDIYPSGTRVNGRPVLNADVVIVEYTGVTGRYTESIGMDYNKYRIGEYVKVKHYNKDINIIEKASEYQLPYDIKEKLDFETGMSGPRDAWNENGYGYGRNDSPDTIVVDGVEYVRK